MRIYYLILAHNDPLNLNRLVDSLQASESSFFIHLDKKTEPEPFEEYLKYSDVCFVPKRVSCKWGDFSLVQATLNGLNEILSEHPSNQKAYIVLLSGQHYPIKSVRYIYEFFQYHYGKVFMESSPLPKFDWFEGGLDRINKYHFFEKERYRSFVLEKFKGIHSLNGLNNKKTRDYILSHYEKYSVERIFPQHIIPHGGSQWWCLPIESARGIVDYVEKHPEYSEYHKETFAPDEIFFHSLLYGCSDCYNGARVVDKSLTFTDWGYGNSPSPKVLNLTHFESLEQSNKLFARKFLTKESETLLKRIDKELLSQYS